MSFTVSVNSFQVPSTSSGLARSPSLPMLPTSFAARKTSVEKRDNLPINIVDRSLGVIDLAFRCYRKSLREVSFGHSFRHSTNIFQDNTVILHNYMLAIRSEERRVGKECKYQ